MKLNDYIKNHGRDYSYKVFVMHQQIRDIEERCNSLEDEWAYAEDMYQQFYLSKYHEYDCSEIDAMKMFLQSINEEENLETYKDKIEAIKKIISASSEEYTDGECIDLIWDIVHPKKTADPMEQYTKDINNFLDSLKIR